MPKISVIVPVYKVELYLHQCIDSILAQTYKNLEVILVNDGSPDNCGAICDEYAEKDNRIKVIHKENGGLSDARNAGIDIATGGYLAFIDSDDWIEPDMVEVLYNNLVNANADISCCGMHYAYMNINVPFANITGITILNSEQAISESFSNKKITTTAWGKLYKKHIFRDIRYPVGRFHEDEFVIIEVLLAANCVVTDTASKYYYRQRKGSIINKDYSSKKMDASDAFEKKIKTIKDKRPNLYPAMFLKTRISVLSTMIFTANYAQTPEYKSILSALRKDCKFILKSSFFTRNEKIKAIAIRINVRLYKLLQFVNNWKENIIRKNVILFD